MENEVLKIARYLTFSALYSAALSTPFSTSNPSQSLIISLFHAADNKHIHAHMQTQAPSGTHPYSRALSGPRGCFSEIETSCLGSSRGHKLVLEIYFMERHFLDARGSQERSYEEQPWDKEYLIHQGVDCLLDARPRGPAFPHSS